MTFELALVALVCVGILLGLLSFRHEPSGTLALAVSLIPVAGVVTGIVFC
ncbi:MAG: hypothetical protein H0W86_08355 [Armatimonadetes bacterium]|nr:hypothetical protein [Armatimonadota bacterium]